MYEWQLPGIGFFSPSMHRSVVRDDIVVDEVEIVIDEFAGVEEVYIADDRSVKDDEKPVGG